MSGLAGTGALLRLALRRDRLRLTIWVAVLGVVAAFSAASIFDLYATEADLAAYAATVQENPAIVAMSGPVAGLGTYGGRISWELWPYGVAVALLGALTATRHTRAEEEAGRTELVRAAAVGRHAHAAAALATAALACAAVGAATAVAVAATALPLGGAVLLGAAFAAVGVVFAAVGLVAAQVTEHARTATGLAAATVGLAFTLRAVGDVEVGWLSWASPFGWMTGTRPFVDDRWAPVALSLAVTLALVGVAVALEARRDVGAGLVVPGPGPAAGGPSLATVGGLAWRLQRAGLAAWAAGCFLAGLAFGSVAASADELVGDNDAIRDYLAQAGGASLADLFLATVTSYLALLAGAFGISSALRLRGEEVAGRTEALLAAPVARRRWVASHLLVALGGSAVVLVASGLGIGLAHAATTGEPDQVPRLVGAALAHAPAAWVLAGGAVALVGLAPRASLVAWAALAACGVEAVFGGVLALPSIGRSLSPFRHVADVPATAPSPLVLGITSLVALALALAGVVGVGRRDLDP